MSRKDRNEVCTSAEGKETRPKRSIWPVIGAILLALYVPPVFAVAIANRWKDVSRRLRAGAIVFSMIFPAAVVLHVVFDQSRAAMLIYPFFGYGGLLMYTCFVVCWRRHKRVRVSLLLKLCFWFAFCVVTVGSLMGVIAYFHPMMRG